MRKILSFLAAATLMFGAETMQMNVIKLKPMKAPLWDFKVEVVFAKKMQADCNYQFLLGGQMEEKNSKKYGDYYEFKGGDEVATTTMLCPDGKKQLREVEYEFKPILPYTGGASDIKILAQKDVIVKYRLYEKFEEKNAKVEK
ncbi:ecotin family protein [Campylobacter curvus]|uniref:ecotin family protein n=1 Tax=Campylobacter curvus TaxID=200 RepID=UPI00037634D0|nr:ecotin family protein [Campylobacter curvus]QKF60715.1 putative serine protease inhibitor, Ecotin family [Campylobacter curvus]UEB49040.1 ecotin family protein [Campylobacter curvus]